MRKALRLICAVALINLIAPSALAGDVVVLRKSDSNPDRPKVGLVLAGGGAKGAAHIGAIQMIEDMGIPVDFVAGTSMGSIIGGFYALGYAPVQIDSIIKSVNWAYYLSNTVEKQNTSFFNSNRDYSYQITIPFGTEDIEEQRDYVYRKEKASADLLSSGEFVNNAKSSPIMRSLPSGFIDGNNLLNLFNDLCVGYQDSLDFNDLPIPYACVATNLTNGSPVVLRSGRMPFAMRSSMAIPLVFSPVDYDGEILVDGGLVNNFPADIVREMGADIVIGVELVKGFKADPAEVDVLPGVLTQLLNIMTSGHNAENRKLCDVYIRPDVTGYSTMSFDAASIDSLVQRGYEEAQKHVTELQKVKDMVGSATKTLQSPPAYPIDKESGLVFTSINYLGISDKDASWLNHKWPIALGENVTPEQLRNALEKYKGTGAFESVRYSMSLPDSTGARVLNLHFKDKEPHNFSLGLRVDSEEAASIGFRLGFNDNRLSGWKFSALGRLSYNPYAEVRLRHSFQGILDINLSYDYSYIHNAFMTFGQLSAQSIYSRHKAKFFLSDFYSRYSSVKVGLDFESYKFKQLFTDELGGDDAADDLSRTLGAFVNYEFDNLDDNYFATKGVNLGAKFNWKYYSFGEDFEETYDSPKGYGDIIGNFEAYWTPGGGPITVIPQVYYRQILGFPQLFSFYNGFGGMQMGRYFEHQLPFVGFNGYEADSFPKIIIPRVDVRWNVMGNHYLTAMANVKHSFDYMDKLFSDVTVADMMMTMVDDGIISIDDYYNIKEDYEFSGRQSFSDHIYNNTTWGFGLKYSYSSFFGPISAQIHWTDRHPKGNRIGFYVSLGIDF